MVDNWEYVSHRNPELKRLLVAGRLTRQILHAERPDIVTGPAPGRETDQECIVYSALGVWGEYAAIPPAVYHRAVEKGLGQKIDLSGVQRLI